MFKNWKRIADQAAARADALECEKRTVEHRVDYLRTERVKMLKQLDALKAGVMRLEHRLKQIVACETPGANATVRRMARIARGEDVTPAKVPSRVDAGPVPDSVYSKNKLKEALEECLTGERNVATAFSWFNSKQGEDYWSRRYNDGLDDEARAIINAWIAELESES